LRVKLCLVERDKKKRKWEECKWKKEGRKQDCLIEMKKNVKNEKFK